MLVTEVIVSWEPVSGATGYEISVNGKVVSTAGTRTKDRKIHVGPLHTLVEVVDLPARSRSQALDFLQAAA